MKPTHVRVHARATRGFTLIELLVVVAIIALLISILLPSLKNAREQAKRVKCQSNMRTLNTGLVGYFIEQNIFPVAYSYLGTNTQCPCGWCSWSYGGWLGKNPLWNNGVWRCFKIAAKNRPLTVYLNKNVSDPIRYVGSGAFQTPVEELTDQPIFKCPSDTRSAQMLFVSPSLNSSSYSAFDDVGTSYQQNFYWWGQTSLTPGTDYDQDGHVEPTTGHCNCVAVPGCGSSNWGCRFDQGRQIWKKYSGKNAGKFITLVEDPFDWAIVNGIRYLGFHGQFSKFNLGFLDTHVEYINADTRKHSEWNWTSVDEELEVVWSFSGAACN